LVKKVRTAADHIDPNHHLADLLSYSWSRQKKKTSSDVPSKSREDKSRDDKSRDEVHDVEVFSVDEDLKNEHNELDEYVLTKIRSKKEGATTSCNSGITIANTASEVKIIPLNDMHDVEE